MLIKKHLYTKEDVFQCKEKLYELEEILEKESFIRISKNTIVNLNKVSKIVPDISRRLILTLENKEKVIVSRSFTFNFKKSLGL